MRRLCRFAKGFAICAGAAAVWAVPGFSQATINVDGASYDVTTRYNKALGLGPAQQAGVSGGLGAGGSANPAGGLQYYSANYTSFGRSYSFRIVGTDPSLGANTTTVPTVIVPIHLTFPNGRVLDGTNQVVATTNSPIFLVADYTTSGTDVGVTQYGDAIQRAEFWNLPGFSQIGYHVLLGTPTIASTVSITIPAGKGNTYGGGFLGVVDPGFFDAQLNALVPSYAPNVLPIFLTDNVFEGTNGLIQNCCVLGYHASEGPPIATAHTWIYASYVRAGTFRNDVILDVQPLSHEVAEWLNDPFVGAFPGGINLVPPAKLPGQGGACIINFETGDPLEAPPVVFTQLTNATTYHLQDEAFLPWYMHTSPSYSVNGFYSYLGTFTTFSSLCGPG